MVLRNFRCDNSAAYCDLVVKTICLVKQYDNGR